MRPTWLLECFLLASALAASPLHASDPECAGLDLSTASAPQLATIDDAPPRTWFVKSSEENADCPSLEAACRERAYLVPGDRVIAWFDSGDFTCASFRNARGTSTTGWLPSGQLHPAPIATASRASDWVGDWQRDDEASIKIVAAKGDRVTISGDAVWGSHDPERVARGGVNIGEIESTEARIAGARLHLVPGGDPDAAEADEYSCVVELQRIGEYLLVDDNGNCGGHNVSFDGVYTRASAH